MGRVSGGDNSSQAGDYFHEAKGPHVLPAHLRVTTTDSIAGWEVLSHHGIVGTQAVAGTWFGSDWLAGVSDIFGGRSGTYQRQLDTLYKAALSELVAKADERGANWVIGVHVDFDEISGGGKQMFMVSLSGTAVRAREIRTPADTTAPTATSASAEHVTRMIRRQALRSSERITEAADIAFLTEEGATECANAIARGFADQFGQYTAAQAEQRGACEKYFRTITPSDAEAVLYPLIERDIWVARGVAELIVTVGLTNYERIRALLNDKVAFAQRKVAIGIIRTPPATFGPDTLPAINALSAAISEFGQCEPELKTRKTMLKGEYQVWVCVQGHESDLASQVCGTCNATRDGYLHDEYPPRAAIARLEAQARALQELFHAPASS